MARPRSVTQRGSTDKTAVFTIGYETATVDSLVERLIEAGVQRVVDVRELPLSRRKGFSKTQLSDALSEAGISYTHVRALGNPKANRELYKGGNVTEGARSYRAQLRGEASFAVSDLASSLSEHRTCLLCLEESPANCHRALIAERLSELHPQITVIHL
jgi:uncharacterized protein (DUF488 family)